MIPTDKPGSKRSVSQTWRPRRQPVRRNVGNGRRCESGDHNQERKISNHEVARKFDAAADVFDQTSNVYTLRRRAETLAAYVRGVSLELGGGTGAVSAALPDRSRAIHSDISPQMCRTARSKLDRPSICLDAECIPLRDETVDTVIASEVIYYLDRPDRLPTEAFRVLRPGGRLVLCATNPAWQWADRARAILRRIGFQRMLFDDGAPDFLPSEKIGNLVQAAGFAEQFRHRIILAPFARFDRLNRMLESGPLSRLGLFSIMVAEKPARPVRDLPAA